MWTWRIEGINGIIGRSEQEFEKMQEVIDEVLKIVKINRWEKEERVATKDKDNKS